MNRLKNVNIYCLINPINDHVFYIGATLNPLKTRLSSLKGTGNSNIKSKEIIKEIKEKGLLPEILLLDIVPFDDATFFEDFYMQLFKSFGFNLTNKHKSNYSRSKDNTHYIEFLRSYEQNHLQI